MIDVKHVVEGRPEASGSLPQKKLICSWSGGKDSCFAFMKAIEAGYKPVVLLNVMNEEGKISRSHGIPRAILQAQADALRLPIKMIESSWENYEKNFVDSLLDLKLQYQAQVSVFGDIDLAPHREWEEKVCNAAGLEALLPLWQQERKPLVLEMLNAGIETMIVSCNETLGERFIGRLITPELLDELEALGVDACGENGEYHTLVINCPLFSERLDIEVVNKLHHGTYWFSEFKMKNDQTQNYE